MTAIHVVGIGLEGAAGLAEPLLTLVQQADLLVGSARHVAYFPGFAGSVWQMGDLQSTLDRLKDWLAQPNPGTAVVLASGDPLFFGLGRLLLETLPPEQLTFHPHVSSVQLAFSRVKLPWQQATLVSAHGRSVEPLLAALRRGDDLIAVLTDGVNTPGAIAVLLQSLDLPIAYSLWICENLGGAQEQVHQLMPQAAAARTFAPLNVVILQRQFTPAPPLEASRLPLLGLPDAAFASFEDRPGLMTKREVRLLVLGELGLGAGQTVWDIGAGTGSVSVEAGRLVPDAQIYAIEKTAMGIALIQQNCQRFAVDNVVPVPGAAPEAVRHLPAPDRVFVGGSGGQLIPILNGCAERLRPGGKVVLALATLEHLSQVMQWIEPLSEKGATSPWSVRHLQVQLSRSVGIANLTRWQPLNPVTLVVLSRADA